jgi:hypothetical protein
MIKHKLLLLDKKSSEIETIYFSNIFKLIAVLPDIYVSDMFYIELEPDIEHITLENYKNLLKANPEYSNFKFPEEIKYVNDMVDWINAWKTLEEVFELSYIA